MNAVVIMARKPEPGKVKTRLVPPLSPENASKIYQCFLLDKIEQVKEIKDASRFIAFTPDSSQLFFEKLIPRDFKLISQNGDDLGSRLASVSDSLFDMGYKRIAIIDSDSPNLPTSYIIEGLDALEGADVVLGPCEDGGYYLIGLSSKFPKVFEGIPWSTPAVAEVTVNKTRELGKTITLLSEWYDVDTVNDLKRLKRELDEHPKDVINQYFCKNTVGIINGIL